MLNFLKNCDRFLVPNILSFALSIRPPIKDETTYKSWISRTSDVISCKSIPELLTAKNKTAVTLRLRFAFFLSRFCELLESGNPIIVRGALKLLIAMISQNLINKEEVAGLHIVPKVAKTLMLSDEMVHIGVCKVLYSLFDRNLLKLSEIPLGFLSEFIRRCLAEGCDERKMCICRVVNSVVELGTESVLNTIFDGELLNMYFREVLKGGGDWDCVQKLVEIAEKGGGVGVEDIKSFLEKRRNEVRRKELCESLLDVLKSFVGEGK
jgi:hypothetical protein